MSDAVRITGSTLARGLLLIGIQLNSASLVFTIAVLPVTAKVGAKAMLVFLFIYHSLGSIRHLVWDSRYALTLKGVYTSGYAVLTETVLDSLYLATI
ncbi:hypothetical protein BC938DRAFT_471442 [Jimgerdemannia flammicorona]|uniref:Succinate dehydrogenase cytochrome b560 subunit n=1 Tax=Jimgerdemannia flammicorona TaxID=994334 RepID=A0A433Q815_9FUNG|nr:hypothetical protein BC938DRAFT_471442 [Jimgerdemannia flammicorona]